MKILLLLSIELLALYGNVFSQQCPPAGLKIQTPACDTPRNLKANVSCEALHVKWKGNKDQTYIVKASYTDPATNQFVEAEASQQSCDDNGNCSATIQVKEETTVNWGVQAICLINNATFYSFKVEGTETVIPYCRSIAEHARKIPDKTKAIRVYPNPTTGYLTVEYYSNVAGTITFKIYDMTGKMVFNQLGNAATKSYNSYQLDLLGLTPGTYMLTVHNGRDVDHVKFVLSGN